MRVKSSMGTGWIRGFRSKSILRLGGNRWTIVRCCRSCRQPTQLSSSYYRQLDWKLIAIPGTYGRHALLSTNTCTSL
jgi:hypothetical protein